MSDPNEVTAGSLSTLRLSWVLVLLSVMVGSEDIRGMNQISLGQPEIILRSKVFEADQIFGSLSFFPVGEDIFHLVFFMFLHHFWEWNRVRRPDGQGPGDIFFEV